MFIPEEKISDVTYLKMDLSHTLIETLYERLENNEYEYVVADARELLQKSALIYAEVLEKYQLQGEDK